MDESLVRYRRVSVEHTLVTLTLFFVSVGTAQAALRIQDFSANEHRRFYVGADKNFIGADFDSSGVGRLPVGNRWATMISDHFFVTATHWHPVVGQTLRFYPDNDITGASESHVVAGGQQIFGQIGTQSVGSDLWLGRLSTAPSDAIARYPILDLSEESAYENLEIYTYGLDSGVSAESQRLGRNMIDPGSLGNRTVGSSTGRSYRFDFDNPGGVGADESFMQGGDSGAPSFVAIGDQLALVGLHWFHNTTNEFSGDTFVPHYLSELNEALLPWRESLTTIVPEPSTFVLLLISVIVANSKRNNRSRSDAGE